MAKTKPQRSVYLGQYTDHVANRIAERLHEAQIPWYFKQAGMMGRVLFLGDWGTRLFVDASRIEQAREIVREVTEAEADEADQTDPDSG